MMESIHPTEDEFMFQVEANGQAPFYLLIDSKLSPQYMRSVFNGHA
jgi:hypothetical protein